MARLNLTLLGGFQGRLGAAVPLTLPTRKSQALLAFLALPPGRSHPRAKLASLLWGGMREPQARSGLRQSLFTLRKAVDVEPPALLIDGQTVALNPTSVDVAVVEFERQVAEGTLAALERAAALYRGELLEGLALQEAPFEEWILAERERLRELALEALAKLLRQQRATGATEAALQTALRLLALDPLQEPVHRAVMRLYVELGRRASALRQYQMCIGVLQRELSVEPETTTKQLYQEISASSPRALSETARSCRCDLPSGRHSRLREATPRRRSRRTMREPGSSLTRSARRSSSSRRCGGYGWWHRTERARALRSSLDESSWRSPSVSTTRHCCSRVTTRSGRYLCGSGARTRRVTTWIRGWRCTTGRGTRATHSSMAATTPAYAAGRSPAGLPGSSATRHVASRRASPRSGWPGTSITP
jgi:DNA-binding SARP family transcriptional activator